MLLCPLTGWRINVVNIQIISGLTKHHSKQLWKTVYVVNVLTIHSILGAGYSLLCYWLFPFASYSQLVRIFNWLKQTQQAKTRHQRSETSNHFVTLQLEIQTYETCKY